MNSLERIAAAVNLKPVDRVPVIAQLVQAEPALEPAQRIAGGYERLLDRDRAAEPVEARPGALAAAHPGAHAAEDQADSVFGKGGAEGAGALEKGRIGTRPRATINADFSDLAWVFASVHNPACALRLRHRQGSS